MKRLAKKLQRTTFSNDLLSFFGMVGGALLAFVGISIFACILIYISLKILMRTRK